jgi:hypothetical protein
MTCFNLVADPAFLVLAWNRVRGNRGARTAGIDGVAPRSIDGGEGPFLAELRDDLKARRFRPLPVRQRLIPKASDKLRSLGIPTARDRVVQASVKLVLEPIFEADFHPGRVPSHASSCQPSTLSTTPEQHPVPWTRRLSTTRLWVRSSRRRGLRVGCGGCAVR